MTLKRLHVFYAGRVHGVGFRATAEETASRLAVTGWVKNLRDGRVETVVEGEETMLLQFLEAIRTGPMRNFIQSVEVSWAEGTGEFRDFEIRYF